MTTPVRDPTGAPAEHVRVWLRELENAYSKRGLSRSSGEHIRRALERRALQAPVRTKLRLWPALAFVAGALLMAFGVHMYAPTRLVATPASIAAAPPPTLPSPEVSPQDRDPTCARLLQGEMAVTGTRCLEDDGVQITALRDSLLQRNASHFWVLEGEVLFDVVPRQTDRVHVYAGNTAIEVKGTRFIVRRDGSGGGLTLLEGRVAVQVGDAPPRDVTEGEHLTWPSPESPTLDVGPSPEAAEASPRRARTGKTRHLAVKAGVTPPIPATTAGEGLADLLAEVGDLRKRGQFAEAVARLRTSTGHLSDPRAKQVISYEIGMLLERQLRDPTRACVHWHEHRRAFADGTYDSLVQRSISRLRCHARPEETSAAPETE